MSIVVAGKEFILPQGIVFFEAQPPLRAADVSVGNCLVAGEVGGSVPFDILVNGQPPIANFTNPTEARAILKSGNGLESVIECFNEGASRVFFIRTQKSDTAKQATLNLTNALVTSLDFADFGNRISVAIDETGGNIVITLTQYTPGVAKTSGTGATAATTVLTDAGGALDTKGIVAGDLLHITAGSVAGSLGFYTVVSVTSTTVTVAETIGTVTGITYEVVPQTKITEVSDSLVATWANFVDFINGVGPIRQFIIATLTTAGTISADQIEAFLRGGADGVAAVQDVTDALALVVETNAQLRTIADGNSALFGILKSHITESRNAGILCMGYVGGLGTEDIATLKTNAAALDSDEMVLVAPANIDNKLDGTGPVVRAGWSLAAKVMGLVSSLDPAEPPTRKTISAVGINTSYTKSEKEDLQENGVLFVVDTPNGKRINKGVTTLQDNSALFVGTINPETPEISLRRIADAISSTVQNGVDGVLVGRNARFVLGAYEGFLKNTLADFRDNKGWLVDGEDATTGEPILAFEILRVFKEADSVKADVALLFADPINFVVMKGIILST